MSEEIVLFQPNTPLSTVCIQYPIVDAFKDSEILINTRPQSKNVYVHNIHHYLDWLHEEHRNGYTSKDIADYRDWLHRIMHHTVATVNGYLVAVRLFYKFLAQSFRLQDIASGIKGLKKELGHRKDRLSIKQLERVMLAIETDTALGLRDYAMLNLMVHTGIRTIEVSRANVEDMHLKSCVEINDDGTETEVEHMVLDVQGKGHDEKDDYVILDPYVVDCIREYLATRGRVPQSAPLFASTSNRGFGTRLTSCSVSVIVKGRFKNAGIDDSRYTAHSLRHTAISLAIESHCELIEVQRMARHCDPRVTMVYIHESDRLRTGAEHGVSKMLHSIHHKRRPTQL